MDDENLISPNVVDEQESQQENVLRPKTLSEYIGQTKVKRKYENLYRSGKKERRTFGPCTFIWTTGD